MANIINVSEGQAEYVIPYNCESVRYDLFLGLWPLTISKAVLVFSKNHLHKKCFIYGFSSLFYSNLLRFPRLCQWRHLHKPGTMSLYAGMARCKVQNGYVLCTIPLAMLVITVTPYESPAWRPTFRRPFYALHNLEELIHE